MNYRKPKMPYVVEYTPEEALGVMVQYFGLFSPAKSVGRALCDAAHEQLECDYYDWYWFRGCDMNLDATVRVVDNKFVVTIDEMRRDVR